MSFDLDNATATEAKTYVKAHVHAGVLCPSCDRYAKVYRRTVNGAMVALLIWLKEKDQAESKWYNIHEFPLIQGRRGGGDFAKLAYWGLLKSYEQACELPNQPAPPNGLSSGRWRITLRGIEFVNGDTHIPKYANVYNKSLLGFSGESVGIETCKGTNFSYEELMS